MNQKLILIVMMVVLSMNTNSAMLNDSSKKYHVSIGSGVGDINSSEVGYDMVIGIPSAKEVNSTTYSYSFGMLTGINITAVARIISVCNVTAGSGVIISQTGSNVDVTINFNNIGESNISCNMSAISGQCTYIATNISFMTVPYNASNELTYCNILLVTNSTVNTRSIRLYSGYIKSEWGKVINGSLILIGLIGIIVGWKKVETEK